ncbi:glucosamine 6-phosphate N-acetyltransferase isoform X1 [Petromyzon marinus]|uniref:Glucosamine 6-phosphate N-acetyltransferase n=1 Tax=Petromyzon marinus TaxID=7757 RepID=A0AAJ7TMF8_PETMA|nr:glucosamine 6-phosphate N-acetyltransferase isoform X1 [Petromyzon marinus]
MKCYLPVWAPLASGPWCVVEPPATLDIYTAVLENTAECGQCWRKWITFQPFLHRVFVLLLCAPGFMKVLSQLTHVGEVTEEQFIARFESLKKAGGYFIVVVEDTKRGTIVATGTLMVEQKFIHCCGTRGRMEDVVVTDECRGKQLGKLLLVTLKLLSKSLGCYKITLECLPKNVAFYEKFDYKTSPESYMQCRFLA